jgi:hypothetical protein
MVLTVNERVKRNYDANRSKILERKRAAYAAKKLKNVVVEVVDEPELQSVTEFVEVIDEPLPSTSKLIPVKIDPLERIAELISGLDISDGNKKFRINNFKTIIKILKPIDYNDLINQFVKRPNHVIKLFKKFEYLPEKKYSENTLIAYYKAILFFLDKFEIPIKPEKKMKYLDQLEINGVIIDKELEIKNNTNKLPSFDEYVEKVIENFGINSREYLIAKMYSEIKCRDNLQLILVRDQIKLSKENNYIVVNEFSNAVVIINNYKTMDKYGVYNTILSEALTTLIKSYIITHQIENDQLFFNAKNISMIICRMNKKLGYEGNGSINLFRKMIATDAKDLPLKEQLKISKQMRHNLKTHTKNYIINETI